MSFLFGRAAKPPDEVLPEPSLKSVDLKTFQLGSNQPENEFKELTILPGFRANVSSICVLDDAKRIVTGDDTGNLVVWDVENGLKLSELKFHSGSINAIKNYSQAYLSKTDKYQDIIVVSSNDKSLTIWNIETYERINTHRFTSSHVNKVVMGCSSIGNNGENYFILAGLDLKLFDLDLNLIDEHSRKTRDNSIKLATMIKTDKFAVATNSDIEVYALVCLGASGDHQKSYIRIKELKKYINSHEDSILCLAKITDNLFASGSSNGRLILWQSDTLIRLFDLRPFDQLVQNEETKRLALTSITSFRCLFERYILVCCGCNVAVYDILADEFSYKVLNAHGDSELTDLIILDDRTVVTAAENASIRIWRFDEIRDSEKSNDKPTLELKLTLKGECLGHSAAIKSIQTITGHEIISNSYDNFVIIWKTVNMADSLRNYSLNKFLSNFRI